MDLFLGGRCVGCGRGGSTVCQSCLITLPHEGHLAWPSPTPAGLVTPYAVAEYAGLVRAMILGHKERGMLDLGRPLGSLLALGVAAAASGLPGDRRAPLILVPVPSRRAIARSRGHDPMLSMTRQATRILRRSGWGVWCAQLLVPGSGLADQSGLDAEARSRNVCGSMRGSVRAWRRVVRSIGLGADPVTIICDDVLTTGSTAREAQRAAESLGPRVTAIATVAATRRRRPG